MKRIITIISLLMLFLGMLSGTAVAEKSTKKILFVDSYHTAYKWSASITKGIRSVLDGQEGTELKIFQMDTKRNKSKQFKEKSAIDARELIVSWKPDVVIASDDNASEYLIKPYFKGKDVPFVFCGVNWDASVYGFPTSNVTGMTEVSLYVPMLKAIKQFAAGDRIGYLASDTASERKELANIRRIFGFDLNVRFVNTFDELKQAYLELQKESDMIIVAECRSVEGFNHMEMRDFVQNNSSVPSGTLVDFLSEYSLVTFSKIGEEQGEYAAQTALRILDGTSPQDIPIVQNKKAKIMLNMKLAKRMKIKFPMELIQHSTFVGE